MVTSGPDDDVLCSHPKVQGTKRYLAPEILDESINAQHFDSWKCADVYRFVWKRFLFNVGKKVVACLMQSK